MFKQFIGKFYLQNLLCRRVNPKNGAKNKMQLKAFNIAIMAVCAALYAVIGILTSFGLTFGGVAFWPAAFIPAIFAVLFGPYEGGFGAAIGIFIHDTIINGQPLLSLAVGVPANFVAFFLIGYLAHKKFDNKKTIISLIVGFVVILAGLLLPIMIYPTNLIGFAFSTTTVEILFAVLMIVSFALFIGIAKFSREFRSFAVRLSHWHVNRRSNNRIRRLGLEPNFLRTKPVLLSTIHGSICIRGVRVDLRDRSAVRPAAGSPNRQSSQPCLPVSEAKT